MRISWITGAVVLGAVGTVAAAEPVAADLPWLPPEIETPSEDASEPVSARDPLGLRAQVWWQRDTLRDAATSHSDRLRLVLDLRREWHWDAAWRAGVSGKLEHVFGLDRLARDQSDDTQHLLLRELWINRRLGDPSRLWFVDVGRINQRGGTGSGYNPTDYFKARSVVSATSLDPGALRVDRLGTVMLRVQGISTFGAWSVALVPDLSDRTFEADADHRSDLSLNLDRTNAEPALYARIAPQISERLSLDVVAYARSQQKPQLGGNLSTLINDSTVANLEWSGGRLEGLPGASGERPDPAWRNRIAANVTWTSATGIELTLERNYSGDALSRDAWRGWREIDDSEQGRRLRALIAERASLQEPLVRDGWFVRAAWRDAWQVRGLHLSSFALANAYDDSALWQFTSEYSPDDHWTISALIGRYLGSHDSEFGATGKSGYYAFYLTRHI